MRHVAFATFDGLPDLDPDDRRLIEPLADRGIEVRPLRWRHPDARRPAADAIVLRSCWDTDVRTGEFLDWLDRLDALGTRVLNPTRVVRWNLDKRHLSAMSAHGVRIPQTIWVDEGASTALSDAMASLGVAAAVVKPTVSLSAHGTWRVDAERADEARWRKQLRSTTLMVQDFLPEIAFVGETSFVFAGESLSHVVNKRPRDGDFRVQGEFGGTKRAVPADPAAVAWARDVVRVARTLATSDEPFTYARVDAVETAVGWTLMEIELIDPSLYLGCDENAPARVADAIDRAVG